MMDSDSKKLSYGTEAAVAKIAERLKQQSTILAAARQELMSQSDSRWKVVVPQLWAIQKSCGSVYFLSEKEQLIGCVVVSRCILEGAINVAYICGAGQPAAEKARRHALQKKYRDMRLYSELKKSYLSESVPDISSLLDDDEFREIIDEFSTKKGHELPYWTPLSLHDRINKIEEYYGRRIAGFFRFCTSAIFRHSSELLHGTYYGALYALGEAPVSQNARSPDDIRRWTRENISTTMLLMIGLLDQIIGVLDTEVGIAEIHNNSDETVRKVAREITFTSDS